MLGKTESYCDIDKLIREENIIVCFQPIVSIKQKSLVGLEALCRGIQNGKIISTIVLFNLAEQKGITLELDRLCRRKALEAFAEINRDFSKYILFINFDSSILDQGVVGSGNILDTVRNLGLNPNNIVIEINETRTNNMEGLDNFINAYKSYGFMIALDDIGAGYSSLNRLAIVKPDILKIDMMLIRDIDSEFYKQEVVKSLVDLSRKIGALVVAEGVETEAEAITSLSIGVDMLQGYYFSRPYEFRAIDFDDIRSKKQFVAAEYKSHSLQKVNKEKFRREYFNSTAKSISVLVCHLEESMLDDKLYDVVLSYENIECTYVLDSCGIQYSGTIFNKENCSIRKKAIFSPAPKGTDHSLKDYYYLSMDNDGDIYVTEPYISLATGNLCVTISISFRGYNSERYILCIDAIMD